MMSVNLLLEQARGVPFRRREVVIVAPAAQQAGAEQGEIPGKLIGRSVKVTRSAKGDSLSVQPRLGRGLFRRAARRST